jgi:hypothetical protein
LGSSVQWRMADLSKNRDRPRKRWRGSGGLPTSPPDQASTAWLSSRTTSTASRGGVVLPLLTQVFGSAGKERTIRLLQVRKACRNSSTWLNLGQRTPRKDRDVRTMAWRASNCGPRFPMPFGSDWAASSECARRSRGANRRRSLARPSDIIDRGMAYGLSQIGDSQLHAFHPQP